MSQRLKEGAPERPRRVVVYSGSDVSRSEGTFYFLNLFWRLITQGKERGWEIFPVMERRSFDDASTPPEEILAIKESGPIDGMVGFMITDLMMQWIDELGIPSVALGGDPADPSRIQYDMHGMVSGAFKRLSELSCRSVGLIAPYSFGEADFMEFMEQEAARNGLQLCFEWILVTGSARDEGGYNCFRSLWGLRNRPEGLLVYPDGSARGVVTAALELGVSLPRELKLILHRNKEMSFNTPLPCDWVESGIQDMAEMLFLQLKRRMRGEPMTAISMPIPLVRGY